MHDEARGSAVTLPAHGLRADYSDPMGGVTLCAPWLRTPFAVAGAALGIVVIASGVALHTEDHSSAIDKAIHPLLNRTFGQHFHATTSLLHLGSPVVVISVAAIAALVLAATRAPRGAVLVAVAPGITALLAELVLKPLVDRRINGNLTFPSGHSSGWIAVSLATVVALSRHPGWKKLESWQKHRSVRWLSRTVVTGAACGALASALALGGALAELRYHYFTDTLAGIALGTGVVLLASRSIDDAAVRWKRRPSP
jgi:hypothetical protein